MIAFDPSYDDSQCDPDTERMIRLAAGDLSAFDELVAANFPSTVRIISSMMGSRCDSEDLAQDVFLRIFRSRQRYVPTAKFATWHGTIIRNVVLNAKRGLSRRRVRSTEFVDDRSRSEHPNDTTLNPVVQWDPAQQVEQQEIVAAVGDAIDRLPPRQRQAIELVCFRGMSYLTAAAEMETSWKAVKSLLGRGRGALSQSLRKEYDRRYSVSL